MAVMKTCWVRGITANQSEIKQSGMLVFIWPTQKTHLSVERWGFSYVLRITPFRFGKPLALPVHGPDGRGWTEMQRERNWEPEKQTQFSRRLERFRQWTACRTAFRTSFWNACTVTREVTLLNTSFTVRLVKIQISVSRCISVHHSHPPFSSPSHHHPVVFHGLLMPIWEKVDKEDNIIKVIAEINDYTVSLA